MKKNMLKILIVVVLVFGIASQNLYAYSDEFFEFDIPSEYGNMSYSGLSMFVNSKNNERIIICMTRKQANGSVRSVWSLSDSEVNMIVSQLGKEYNVIETDKKAKLGNEKAIKLKVIENDVYMEGYLLTSKDNIHFIAFASSSLSDLDNEEFRMVKDSFKLKETSSNTNIIFIIAVIGIVGTMLFLYIREKNNKNNVNTYYTNDTITDINNTTINTNEENDINNFDDNN